VCELTEPRIPPLLSKFIFKFLLVTFIALLGFFCFGL
jgi:hypothetical protein